MNDFTNQMARDMRAALSYSASCESKISKADRAGPAYSWRVFVKECDGENRVFLAISDEEDAEFMVMGLSTAGVKGITKEYNRMLRLARQLNGGRRSTFETAPKLKP